MMVMHVDTILSPDDLSKLWAELAQDEQLPDRYELSEHGEVVMSPKPHNRHQLLCSQIAYQLQTQLGGASRNGSGCPKGLSRNNLRNLAPGFGSDLDGTIEKKPRHRLDYVEVVSIEARSKMARRWDARW